MHKKSYWGFISVIALLIMSFVTLTYLVKTKKTSAFDKMILEKMKDLESPLLTTIMKGLDFIGSTIPVIVTSLILLVILYRLHRNRSEVYLFVVASLGSNVINYLVKSLIKRKRPVSELVIENGFSFPSGHTIGALTLYGIITFLFWRKITTTRGRVVLLIFATSMILLMGFSRIYLGVHYPTDIIGAMLLGGTWLYLTIWIYQYMMEKRANKQSS